MEESELKDIPGFSKYSITSDGKIWSKKRKVPHSRYPNALNTKGGKWIKTRICSGGYVKAELRNDTGEYKSVLIHRLVLSSWNRLPEAGEHCDHVNGNRSDNRIENLRWLSPGANSGRANSKYFIITYTDGREELIFNLSKFCRENSISKSGIVATLFGKDSYKGMSLRKITRNG